MDYSIKPEEHGYRSAKQSLENIVASYEYALDIGSVSFNLGWQKIDGARVVAGDGEITVVLNPDEEPEDLEKKVLRGLLELEFVEKAEYDEIMFNWQEVLKLAYVKHRTAEILDEERVVHERLGEMWPDLKDELGKRTGDFSQEFYMNAALLGESLGTILVPEKGLEELPYLNQSDVVEAGEELFG